MREADFFFFSAASGQLAFSSTSLSRRSVLGTEVQIIYPPLKSLLSLLWYENGDWSGLGPSPVV